MANWYFSDTHMNVISGVVQDITQCKSVAIESIPDMYAVILDEFASLWVIDYAGLFKPNNSPEFLRAWGGSNILEIHASEIFLYAHSMTFRSRLIDFVSIRNMIGNK
jgi:hypothetical protein